MPGRRRSLRNLFNRKSHKRNPTIELVPAPPTQKEVKEHKSFLRRIFGCCFPISQRRQAGGATVPSAPPSTPVTSQDEGTATEGEAAINPTATATPTPDTSSTSTPDTSSTSSTETSSTSTPETSSTSTLETSPTPTQEAATGEWYPMWRNSTTFVKENDLKMTSKDVKPKQAIPEIPVSPLTDTKHMKKQPIVTNEKDEDDEQLQADIDEIFRTVPSAPGAPCRRFTPKISHSPSSTSESEEETPAKRSPSKDSLASACESIMNVTPSESKAEVAKKITPPQKVQVEAISSDTEDEWDNKKAFKHTNKRPFSPEFTPEQVELHRIKNMTPWERLNDLLPQFRVRLVGVVKPLQETPRNPTFLKKRWSTVFAGCFEGTRGLSLEPVIFKGSISNMCRKKLQLEARVMNCFKGNKKFVQIYGFMDDVAISHYLLGNFALVTEFVGNQESRKSYTLHDVCVTRSIIMGFSRLTAIRMALDVAVATNTMHKAGLLHCNLTCKSVLISPTSPRYSVKLSKFGNTCAIDKPLQLEIQSSQSTNPFAIINECFDDYAPELYEHALPTIKSDVYSLGKILCKIGTFSHVGVLQTVGEMCTSKNPEDRPSVQTILNRLEGVLDKAGAGARGQANGPGREG